MQLCSLYTYMSPNLVPPRKKNLQSSTISVGHMILFSVAFATMQDVSALRWASDRLRSSKVSVMAWVMDFFPQLVGMKSMHWGAQPKLWEHSGVNNLFISNLGRCSCTRFISSVTQVFQKIPWSVNQMRKRRESK